MDAMTWKIISIVGYSLAFVFLVAAIILFYKMNIRTIIGDLTGKTAARQIQEIRERNTMTAARRNQPAAFHLERGTLGTTDTGTRKERKIGKTAQALAHASKRLDIRTKTSETYRPPIEDLYHLSSNETEVLSEQASVTEVLADELLSSEKTKVFGDEKETEVLGEDTEVLGAIAFTEVLAEPDNNGTEVLSEEDETSVSDPTLELEDEYEKSIRAVHFKIVKDIKVIHTGEVIESE
jgi:hypothetical protein